MTPLQTYTQWQATRTRRWHANPALSSTEDPVGAHSARMVILALYFCPDLSREAIIYIIQHDLAELLTGDVPYPVKHHNPPFNEALLLADEWANQTLGIPVSLSPQEKRIVRFVDRLDAWLWMSNHTHDANKKWAPYTKNLILAAQELDFDDQLYVLMDTHHAEGPLR